MSRMKVPVIAITETAVREFDSVTKAAEAYGIQPAQVMKLIETGQLAGDGRTCFDYVDI